MNFLAQLAAMIITPLLKWLVDKITRSILLYQRLKARREAIKKKNQAVLDKTLKAETPKELEDAAKDIVDNF